MGGGREAAETTGSHVFPGERFDSLPTSLLLLRGFVEEVSGVFADLVLGVYQFRNGKEEAIRA